MSGPRSAPTQRRIVEVTPDFVTRFADALARRAERRARGGIVPEAEIPDDLAHYAPGQTYGRFQEIVVRREVRTEGVPAWFDPRAHNSGHFGIVGRNGLRVYLAVEIDLAARMAPSVFDQEIATLAVRTPVQDSLLDLT
jgi:hypothetical protein